MRPLLFFLPATVEYITTMKFPVIFRKQTVFVPTPAGCLIITTILAAVFLYAFCSLNSFLSPYHPLNSKMIVVEGWNPDYAFEQIAMKFKGCDSITIVVTGGPLESGSYLKEYKTYAAVGAATFIALGIADSLVKAVPAHKVIKDRTFTSAISLRSWFDSTNNHPKSFDIYTLGPHARRSALLFKTVFGKDVQIGIVPVIDKDYDPKHWWKSSQGVRSVTDELIAYLYVKLVFSILHTVT
jgi:hypothetical protein